MSSSSESPPVASNTVQPYRMHVSQKYLDLTRQKLEATRLPRDPRNAQQRWELGVQKDDLEPLIDHWLEGYDFRAQEMFYNDTLPQFRVPINSTRLHFVHKRSQSARATPLLIVPGYPESFICASKTIDALSNPIATPPRGDENVQSFHVVVPSIPGFGFSDPIPEAANNMKATAEVFDTLMKGLGYNQYICHGVGWGFRICRIIGLAHPESCIAIHTVNPEVPASRFGLCNLTRFKHRIAKLTYAIVRRSTFAYSPDELVLPSLTNEPMRMTPATTPPSTPGAFQAPVQRPQTIAYALADSPSGLLAYILDAIQPPKQQSAASSPSHSPEALRPPTAGRSPISPQGYGTPQTARSPRSPVATKSPQALELADVSTPWTPTALLNWTMMYWLPGPEVALRWLANSASLVNALWVGHSNVPLGITYFQEPVFPGAASLQSPPQWAEAYHRIAMLRRRDGRVRFPAWERPAEVVLDIRELADILGIVASSHPVTSGI